METREQVFQYLIRYKRQHQGNTPTLSQIMKACGLGAKSHAKYHVDKLVLVGRITRAGRNIYLPGGRWEMGEGEDG